MNEVSDEELMLSYRDGDMPAFERLYARHKGALYRYFRRNCSGASIAEELFQDVWMRIINARRDYVASAKFKTYLYRIAHNRLIDHYRMQSGESYISVEQDDAMLNELAHANENTEPVHQLSLKQQVEHFMQALSTLPDVQREVFLLREEAELSIQEIADVMHVTHETAKSRLRYAYAKLRQQLNTPDRATSDA